jgi:hypothetical protein
VAETELAAGVVAAGEEVALGAEEDCEVVAEGDGFDIVFEAEVDGSGFPFGVNRIAGVSVGLAVCVVEVALGSFAPQTGWLHFSEFLLLSGLNVYFGSAIDEVLVVVAPDVDCSVCP